MNRLLPFCIIVAAPVVATQQAIFQSRVEVVELDVSVTRSGKPVHGLGSRDFVVTDSGVPQQVATARLDDLPLDVTMALDVSQSVSGDRLTHLVDAARELTRTLRAGDQSALVTFSHAISLAVPMTTDMELVHAALGRLTASGTTALRDAVHLSAALQPQIGRRSLILLFTDGRDTASWLTEEDVLQSVRRTGTVIHIVRTERDGFTNRLADATGGRAWSATSDRQLRELFTGALQEMRARYLLTYSPRGVSRPGWHEINVRLREGRADITARPGYFVAEPESR